MATLTALQWDESNGKKHGQCLWSSMARLFAYRSSSTKARYKKSIQKQLKVSQIWRVNKTHSGLVAGLQQFKAHRKNDGVFISRANQSNTITDACFPTTIFPEENELLACMSGMRNTVNCLLVPGEWSKVKGSSIMVHNTCDKLTERGVIRTLETIKQQLKTSVFKIKGFRKG